MKNISILGSTGSIGRQTLEVISGFPENFNIIGLSGGCNIKLLAEQIKKFKPRIVAVKEDSDINKLSDLLLKPYPKIYSGIDGLIKIGEHPENQMVVVAVVGYVGLIPTIRAMEAGKDIALANKETLVIGGAIIENLLREKKVNFLPVDSEHSAIFQCLNNSSGKDISRIILTASGGPFRNTLVNNLKEITPQEALAHPVWHMGPKITIDSATMMNKGFEVIEAKWLFHVGVEKIQVLIHPQSIVHSLVEFKDRSVLAQMSPPDMRLPIQYALSYPERLDGHLLEPLDLVKIGRLDFEQPDMNKFHCLSLAYEAIHEGETMPAVLNAANEVAVSAFLSKNLRFDKIPVIIAQVMKKHKLQDGTSLEDVLQANEWAFSEARNILKYMV